jgi:hypothetical protein
MAAIVVCAWLVAAVEAMTSDARTSALVVCPCPVLLAASAAINPDAVLPCPWAVCAAVSALTAPAKTADCA